MKGKIKAYSPSVNAGVIKGDDGNNYSFARTEWLDSETPDRQNVDFDALPGRAIQIKTS